jgi:c-di-GMP-binding flagellar brake protein YcgR
MVKTPSNKMPGSNNVRSDPTAIRHSFRVPVEFQADIAVMLGNQTYRVVDISPEGVNIEDKDQGSFTAGQLIENFELIIQGSRIKGLNARIVHCSSDTQRNRNYGIQWIDLADEAQQQIVEIVLKIKQRLRQAAMNDSI